MRTYSSGGDETDLLTWNGRSGHSTGLSDMLVVTSSVRVVYGVHGNTTGSWPAVPLDLEFVVSSSSLEHWLVDSATSCTDTDHTSGSRRDNLLGTRWELQSSLSSVWVVSDNDNIVSGCSSERTTVSHLLLNIRGDGTLWHGSERKDVSDVKGSLLSGIDELTGVHAFVCNECLGSELVLVWITEDNLGQRSTTTRVVDDVLDYSPDVTMSLGVIEGSELGSTFTKSRVRLEDTTRLSLGTDDSTHL